MGGGGRSSRCTVHWTHWLKDRTHDESSNSSGIGAGVCDVYAFCAGDGGGAGGGCRQWEFDREPVGAGGAGGGESAGGADGGEHCGGVGETFGGGGGGRGGI